MGILTLFPVDNCLPAQGNEILCGIELALGFVVLGLLFRDMKRVSSTLQAMLGFYCGQVLCIVIICAISLANADPTIEAKYAIYSLGHVAFAFALACRTSVLARVVYMSSQTRFLPLEGRELEKYLFWLGCESTNFWFMSSHLRSPPPSLS